MGIGYARVFCHADDVKLLAPSVRALEHVINICENFANEFDNIFNKLSQKRNTKVLNDDYSVAVLLFWLSGCTSFSEGHRALHFQKSF